MTAIHARLGQPDADLDVDGARRSAVHADARGLDGADHAASPILGRPDPRLASPGSAAAGLMALQRTAGNAAVASLLAPRATVQRDVQIDEMTSRVDVSDAAAGAAGAAGATAGGPGGPVTSDGANTTITGAMINLDTPMTQTGGVIRAGTIIADSVVATSYSPGAGNLW